MNPQIYIPEPALMRYVGGEHCLASSQVTTGQSSTSLFTIAAVQRGSVVASTARTAGVGKANIEGAVAGREIWDGRKLHS